MFEPKVKEIDFMNELEAAYHMRPSRAALGLFFAVIGFFTCALLWAAIARVDTITRAQGQVAPSQDIQIVQSLEGGVLEEILVREGETVKKGDILLRISDIQFSSQERGTQAASLSLQAKKARLEAEARGAKLVLPDDVIEQVPQVAENEVALYESRQKELNNSYQILDDRIAKVKAQIAEASAQINAFTTSRKLLRQELEITEEMVKKRAVPKVDQIRLEREINDLSGQVNAAVERRRALESELEVTQTERQNQLDKFQSQALGELNQVEADLASLNESLKSIGDRVDRAELRAPVDGIVNLIAIKTIGGVIEPAMRLVEIVPMDDELKIIAQVSANDFAFIRPGLPAKVKITAYDPTKYGSLNGTVIRTGASSQTDREGNVFFEIEVRTEQDYMGSAEDPLAITPGMVANVEVLTGKRTILEYLMKPILRARQRAFTER